MNAVGDAGEVVNDAVGVPAGGRMMPIGIRWMSTVWVLDATKSAPINVAAILMQPPGVGPLPNPGAHDGMLDASGSGAGDVYTAVARPSRPVTTVRPDNVP